MIATQLVLTREMFGDYLALAAGRRSNNQIYCLDCVRDRGLSGSTPMFELSTALQCKGLGISSISLSQSYLR